MNNTGLQFFDVRSIDLEDVFSRFSEEEKSICASINDRIAAGDSLGDILDFIFEQSHSLFPCDRLGLAFVEEDGQRVVAHDARASYEPVLLHKGYHEDFHGSSLEKVFRENQLRIINDLPAYYETVSQSPSTKLLLEEGVQASMTCPLYVEGRAVGLFFRSSKKKNVYTDHEVHLHLAMAQRMSQAVEKAWRIEQLEAANHAYMEMLGFVSHEFKNPLSTIIMGAKTLEGGYLGELNEKQKATVERVIRKSDYLVALVKEYLDLARLEGGELSIQKKENIDFAADILEPGFDVVAEQAEEKGMEIIRDLPADRILVSCDPNLLVIVVVNLIGNAIKYGDEKGTVKISLSKEGENLRFSVWNSGPGFPADQKSKLFRKFSRLNSPELMKRKGSGVGLYTSWKIARLHDGSLTADSKEGEWAEFTLRLPHKSL